MLLKLLFPSDYFDKSAPDEAYKEEYAIAKSLGFGCLLFDYDEFIETKSINLKNVDDDGMLLYRGWMLKLQDYSTLYDLLSDEGYLLLNSAWLYEIYHHFNDIYSQLEGKIDTPKIITIKKIDDEYSFFNSDIGYLPLNVKEHFKDYFIMKDNVKSVKGSDFPDKISVDISDEEFTKLVEKFIQLRGGLYTGEIVLKQYENLKKYGNTTNEWRVFYFLGKVMTVNRNSNQSDNAPRVPDCMVNNEAITNESSFIYTADFAETEDGRWILIETGDGQVSGLSPNQNILEFYTKIQNYWNEKYK